MQELIEKIVTYLPKYFIEFAKCIAKPKTFLSSNYTNTDSSMREALLFIAISLVIYTLLSANTLQSHQDIWTQLIRNAVYIFLSVIAITLATQASWNVLGVKSNFLSYFSINAYLLGISFVFLSLDLAMYAGTIKAFYPKIHHELLQETNLISLVSGTEIPKIQLPDNGKGAVIALLVMLVGFVAFMIWAFVAWGVFRQVNNSGIFRSFLATVIATIITIILMTPIILVDAAFM